MRILLITQWFDPEPTLKGLEFARALQALGHEVEVITGYPNYPGGRLYPGYRIRPFRREEIEGVRVLRVPLYPSHDRSPARRALNYLSFGLAACVGVLAVRRPDVAYVYHPPGTASAPALVMRLLRGVPFVCDIQDLWPDSLSATKMISSRGVLGAVGGFMRLVYASSAAVTVLSPGFKAALERRGVPGGKVTVIPNWTAEPRRPQKPSQGLSEGGDAFVVLYAGNLGSAQGLDVVIDAARLLDGATPTVRFVLLGDGVDAARLRARAGDTDSIRFEPPLSAAAAADRLAGADALLVHLREDPLFEITIPSKTQAYLRAGRPILMGVRGDAARIVEDAGAGIAFAPQNPSALAEAVLTLMRLSPESRLAMGAAGRDAYDRRFSLENGARAFAEVLERARIAGRRRAGLKRLFDIAVSAALLVALGPSMLVLGWTVRRKFGSTALFRQVRPGRFGRPFEMLKFRSMTDARGPDGELLSDVERLTSYGRWLRSTSLDELPELINVLKGDMSLVGPRPLLMRYLPLYSPEQARRHEVRPGITGLAQVSGRNSLTWTEKLALDVWYVDHASVGLDLRIMCKTIATILSRKGVNPAHGDIMPEFTGEA